MNILKKSMRPWAAFLICGTLAAIAYAPGLSGPLLLDDFNNLADVGDWLAGKRTWESVIFNNRSGPLGRPIAMASFVLDGALFGDQIWYAKLTNLALHIACGAIVFALLRHLLPRDGALARHATWLSAYLAGVWLLLPINVSSVLYLVQRMAILSALFSLLALWVFVIARRDIELGLRRGVVYLWVAVPLLTILAAYSKENGALVPLLAFALELVYFRPLPGTRRPRSVNLFFATTVILPAALLSIVFATRPTYLLGGYIGRDFTLVERLLTEGRILWEYSRSVLVPFGPALGIFHDNHPKSSSLLEPWTTTLALISWVAVLIAAWRLRRLHPSVIGGLLFFLFGHAMESTVLPLELYFEHRNYLPGIGLLLASAGAINALLSGIRSHTRQFRAALCALALLIPIVYFGATYGRSRVWSSLDTLYAQELRYNPDSPRLRSFLAGRAMTNGDLDGALVHIEVAERNNSPREAVTASIWRLLAYCASDSRPPPNLYAEFRSRAHGPISMAAMVAWEELAKKIERRDCKKVDLIQVTEIGSEWTSQNPMPAGAHANWRTRYYLSRLLAYQSRLDDAANLAANAWIDSGYNNGIGVFLFQVNAARDDWNACRRIYGRLSKSRGGDLALNRALDRFRDALAMQGFSMTE